MFQYNIFNQTEMEKRVDGLKVCVTDTNNTYYEGFHYFDYWNWQEDDLFFVAHHNEKIVGVCLLQKSPYYEKVWWISYVDIHEDYKRQGICTGLYHLINNWVQKDTILYGSSLSREGKSAKLYELRANIINNCINFRNDDEFNSYLINNGGI